MAGTQAPSLPPPDEFQGEPSKPEAAPKTAKAKAAPAPATTIDQTALNAAIQLLSAAGMQVVANPGPKGPCPDDPLTGRKGYYQTTTDANGRQHTVRVYSGFSEEAKGHRPDRPVETAPRRRR